MPFLTRPPVPEIAPSNTLLPLPPRISDCAPRVTVEPVTPANEPMVWLAPDVEMSKPVPAAVSVTAPVAARLPPGPIASVPALMKVPPV